MSCSVFFSSSWKKTLEKHWKITSRRNIILSISSTFRKWYIVSKKHICKIVIWYYIHNWMAFILYKMAKYVQGAGSNYFFFVENYGNRHSRYSPGRIWIDRLEKLSKINFLILSKIHGALFWQLPIDQYQFIISLSRICYIKGALYCTSVRLS